MVSTVKLTLLKIFPVFLGTIAMWHLAGLATFYHACLAASLDAFFPLVDQSDLVTGVTTHEGEFVFRVLFQGKETGLNMTCGDITSNSVLLIALFLASPIKPIARIWLASFLGSILILFAIHAGTAVATVVFAFSTNPDTASAFVGSATASRIYTRFYVEYGMYAFVLVLWVPYFVIYLSRQRHASAGTSSKHSS